MTAQLTSSERQVSPPSIVSTRKSILVMRCHFPEQTSEDAMDTIVRGLEYVGVLNQKDAKS